MNPFKPIASTSECAMVVVPRDFGQRIGRFLQHGVRRMLTGTYGGLFA